MCLKSCRSVIFPLEVLITNGNSVIRAYHKRNGNCTVYGALKKKRAGVWNVQTGDNIVACVTKCGSDKSAEVHCPPLKGHG